MENRSCGTCLNPRWPPRWPPKYKIISKCHVTPP